MFTSIFQTSNLELNNSAVVQHIAKKFYRDVAKSLGYSSARFRFAESFFENWLSAQQPLSDALDAAAIGTVGTSERKALQIWGNTQLAPQGAF